MAYIRIPYAQPSQEPPYKAQTAETDLSQTKLASNLYVCGDYRGTATLNGALQSGRKAAKSLLADLNAAPTL